MTDTDYAQALNAFADKYTPALAAILGRETLTREEFWHEWRDHQARALAEENRLRYARAALTSHKPMTKAQRKARRRVK